MSSHRSGSYQGRLELTWTNKDQRLLAHDDGSYEWLPPADYRVAEVRLLHAGGDVGKVQAERNRAADNLLIRGDALHGLTSLIELPEFARHYVGKVRLAYLDPPFNTKESWLHYDDALEHSVWLTMMRDRLLQVRSLLAPDGSIWVHADDSEQHRLRDVMDEVFGPQSWVATVIWQKRVSRDNRAAFSPMHDYLHVYSPLGPGWSRARNRLPDEGEYSNPDNDPKGPWRSIPMTAQAGHATQSQFYELTSPTGVRHRPPKGRAWTYTPDRFEQLVREGRVYWPKGGDGRPRLKGYPDESEGLVPFTVWLASEVGDNDEAKKQILELFPGEDPFDTPKPERLMHRIIQIASQAQDIVLDCFLGSGTTAAVAQKMGRRWVGIEREARTIERFASPRLARVVAGSDPTGVTELTKWAGGGGFRCLDVAASMFSAEGGQVFLSEWATNGRLAEVTAAQLRYEYVHDPPFAGRRGHSRLAVIDGLVNEGVVRLLVSALDDKETLVVCGTAIDPAAREAVRTLRKGSSVRKIPQSILRDYRRTSVPRQDGNRPDPA